MPLNHMQMKSSDANQRCIYVCTNINIEVAAILIWRSVPLALSMHLYTDFERNRSTFWNTILHPVHGSD